MDSVMEKFDLLDFFNLIIAGAVFLIGLGFYDNDIQCHLNRILCMGGKSTFSMILMIALFIALSYIAGLVFNALGLFIFSNRYHDSLIENCLNDPAIVGNKVKMEIYRKKANDFFEDPEIKDDRFSKEQCSCFFAHCVYFIQARAQNEKAEKLRDVQGLSRLLTVSFAMLFFSVTIFVCQNVIFIFIMLGLIGVFVWFLNHAEKSEAEEDKEPNYLCGILLGVLFLIVIAASWDNLTYRQQVTMMAACVFTWLFYLKFRKDVSNRVRLVLAVYDICKDMKDS